MFPSFRPLLLAAALTGLSAAAPAPRVAVTAAHFYTVSDVGRSNTPTEVTGTPELRGVMCYVWSLEFEKGKGETEITEDVEIPASDANHGLPGRLSIRHPVELEEGAVAQQRCTSPRDPAGKYSITLREGDTELHRFEFSFAGLN